MRQWWRRAQRHVGRAPLWAECQHVHTSSDNILDICFIFLIKSLEFHFAVKHLTNLRVVSVFGRQRPLHVDLNVVGPDGHITTQTHSVFVRPPLVTAVNTTNSSEKEEEEDMKRKEEGVMQRTERWLFTLRGKEKTREEDNRETQLQKKPSHLFILPQHRYHQWLPVRTAHQLSWLKMLN